MATPRKTIAVVGLGSMGLGMALSLARAGLRVCGFDPRDEPGARLTEAGGTAATSPEAAARGADVVVLVVRDQAQAETALFGPDGAGAGLEAGSTVMLSSTVAVGYVRGLEDRLWGSDLHLLDAPISGGPVAAQEGRLTIMASGPQAAFAACEGVLEACARQVYRLGDAPGIGTTVKTVNQLLAGVALVAAAEGMAFGRALGADPKVLYEVIRNSAGGSWMFDNRVPHMLDDDYTPRSAVDIWVKDLGLVLDTADALRMPVPLTAAAHQVVMMAAAQGLGPIDDAGFVKVYERFTGKPIVGPGDSDDG